MKIRQVIRLIQYVCWGAVLLGAVIQPASADEFYQWHLDNDGSLFQKDYDDIHSAPIQAVAGFDVDGIESRSQPLSKRPVVAVLDTGLDLDHPEFSDRIAKNLAECDAGSLPAVASADQDGNGYQGDCLGYNIVDNNHRPYDNSKGHGTHISGIIAATADGIGVEGVDDRILILPVKVLDRGRASAETFAKGIDYAVSRKVDVINLSLGWPEVLNTAKVEAAIARATAAGVFVVAAAGNNSHDRPIYPCAYDGVVCVGAADPDGSASSFSNYGGTVDIVAPGYAILSTIPRKNLSKFLRVEGYDYRSGTSQAAPQVAAALALIKARFPEESREDHLARLFGNTLPIAGARSSLFGLVQISKALSKRPTNLIWPQLAESQFVSVDAGGRFQIKLPFVNLSTAAAATTLSLSGFAAGISLDRSSLTSKSVVSGGKAFVQFTGRVDRRIAPARVEAVLTAKTAGVQQVFPISFALAEEWQADQSFTLQSAGPYESCLGEPSCFYSLAAGSLHLAYLSAESALKQLLVRVASDSSVLSVQRLKTGFAIQTKEEIAGITQLGLRFVDFSGNSLLGGRDVWSWRPEYASPNGPLQWLERPGAAPLAVFLSNGPLPDLDRDDFAGAADPNQIRHLYVLVPNAEGELQTRVIDSAYWREDLAQRLNLKFDDFIDIVSYFKHSNGSSYLIVSTGRGVNRSVHRVRIDLNPNGLAAPESREKIATLGDTAKIELPAGVNLDGNQVLTVAGAEATAQAYIALEDSRRVRTIVIDYSTIARPKVVSQQSFRRELENSDVLIGGLGAFKTASGYQIIYETKSSLVAQAQNTGRVKEFNIYRYSFLPGELFSQLFLTTAAGLYFDNTSMRQGSIGLITFDGGLAEITVQHQQSLPSSCQPLSPKLVGGSLRFFAQCGRRLEMSKLGG